MQRLASPATAAAADQLLDAEAGTAAAPEGLRTELEETYRAETARISGEIRSLAGWDRFREAVSWQNHRVVERSFDRLVREGSPARNFRQRRDEMNVALYLQRYCAKNDTIGFFGPVGWASLSDEGEVASVRPGPGLVSHRQVYFENWAIDALAGKLAADPDLRPWLAPRLKTGLMIEPIEAIEEGKAGRLYRPGGAVTELPPAAAKLLLACDGTKTAVELAEQFSAGPGALQRDEVFALLKSLRESGVLNWTLEVPLELYPERTLRRSLERIAPEDLRERALAPLEELEAGRRQVALAAGNAEDLRLRMREMEETFTRLTGLPAEHNPGMTYGARGLLYEDCRRDVEARFGPALMARMAPLDLVLRSARWLAGEMARGVNEHLAAVHAALRERTGTDAVDSFTFFGHALARLFPPTQREACFGPVEREFNSRWLRVLGLSQDGGERCLERASADLTGFEEAFGDAGPAWDLVRYFTPDIMIAARGEEALRRGDCELVMAELHASNTLLWSFFVAQHPHPEELRQALADDWGERPLVLTQVPKARQTQRTSLAAVLPHFQRYEFADEAPGRPECQTLAAAGMLIEATDEGLRARTRDGAVSFPAIELFGIHLVLECNRILTSLLPPWRHVPRVKIDGLVVQRETWRFEAAELDFVEAPESAERFLAVRRWARRHGLPRYCFYKSPSERKPCFLDLASPVYVDLLVKLARGADRNNPLEEPFVLSEMAPDLDHVWLKDAEGQSYACELRIVAVESSG